MIQNEVNSSSIPVAIQENVYVKTISLTRGCDSVEIKADSMVVIRREKLINDPNCSTFKA